MSILEHIKRSIKRFVSLFIGLKKLRLTYINGYTKIDRRNKACSLVIKLYLFSEYAILYPGNKLGQESVKVMFFFLDSKNFSII